MDLDFSRKIILILFVEKLLNIEPIANYPRGAIHWNDRTGETLIHLGEGYWSRVL